MSTDLKVTPIQAAFNRGLWVADLRSGKYSQTLNRMRDNQGYCCLGVAGSTAERVTGGEVCHFSERDGMQGYAELIDGFTTWTDWAGDQKPHASGTALTESARVWLGLDTTNGVLNERGIAHLRLHHADKVGTQCLEVGAVNLTTCNDSYGLTFSEIADLIEADGVKLAPAYIE